METLSRDYLAALMANYDLPDPFTRPAWHADAACREHPELSWFPGMGVPTAPAKAVCHTCPVQAECLADALEHNLTTGVWGGTSDRERRRLRR